MNRRLILKMSITLDGFVGGPNGEIDWLFPSLSDDAREWTIATISSASLHLMGSRTFKDMMAWWPRSTDPVAKPMNDIPKAVYSRDGDFERIGTTRALEHAKAAAEQGAQNGDGSDALGSWNAAEIVSGDLAKGVSRLKDRQGDPIVAHGGATFVRHLIATGLIDEYRLLVHPVALGRGKAIFSDLPRPLDLVRIDGLAFSSGAVAHVYRPAAATIAGK